MLWKWTKRIGLGFLGTVTALAVSGAVYQYLGAKLDQKRFPPMGEMIDVGGYRLHLYRTGKGSPTVVLDSGLGGNLLDWALVQPKVAEFTQVVSIDRAGAGASDESPLERTSENIAEELRLALHKANIYGPYILVGHSFGGLNARVYASKFPFEVAGVVLVDSSHEDQIEKIPLSEVNLSEPFMLFSTWVGLTRFIVNSEFEREYEMFPKEIRRRMLAQYCTTKFVRTFLKENGSFEKSCSQLQQLKGILGNKPLTVISAAKTLNPSVAGLKQESLDEIHAKFQVLQKDLVTKSNYSKQVIAEKSDHMVPRNQPEIIVDAIREQVEKFNQR